MLSVASATSEDNLHFQIDDRDEVHGMVGRSSALQLLFEQIRMFSPYFRTLLISGETGTGKELVARALHAQSPGRRAHFVACNCAAIADGVSESELFGHERGSFTGATRDRLGLFEYAQGGTVFLDEVGDLSMTMQAKLLRVLQTREIQRVGSPQSIPVDVRVISATNRDLRAMVEEKTFREDLYYRLSMIEVRVPPMRERKEDGPLLQEHFRKLFNAQYGKSILAFTPEAQQILAKHSWPGNVRELEAVIGKACLVSEDDVIGVEDLPASFSRVSMPANAPLTDNLTLAWIERRHAKQVLDHASGNKARAAELLGISRATLYRLLRAEEV